jgi:virulence-associated protein VagC
MKLDKDLFPANMNTIKLNGKKVLVRPSQVELTKGKEVIIGEERQPRMIRPKNLKIDRWKKNERSKQQSHPKVTFDVLMAKYRDGKADFWGRKNWTIQFPKPDYLVSLDQASTSTTANLGHRRDRIQKFGIVINRSIL